MTPGRGQRQTRVAGVGHWAGALRGHARALLLGLSMGLGLAAPSHAADDVAAQAAAASAALHEAVQKLQAATGSREQVSALTGTIRAYEEGLAALREALRQAELRETALKLRLQAKGDRVAQLLAVLTRMERNPAPLLLLHPEGPLGTARSGMMLADVTPAMQREVQLLRAELDELSALRKLQVSAGETLSVGLETAQAARTALSQAISERSDLPKRYVENPEAMRQLLESADTLDSFAAGLALSSAEADGVSRPFIDALGVLPLPTLGMLIRRPDEADAAGVRRPGMALATRPRALVTAPWPSTIRYRGPLLDYGNVMILEPGDGYLLVLAGMATLYGEVGEVVPAGAPLGLMGGVDPVDILGGSTAASLAPGQDEAGQPRGGARDGGAGATGAETLYLELRLGAAPVDPTEWFAATASSGE